MYQITARRLVAGAESVCPVYLRSTKSDEYQARPLSFTRKVDAHAVVALLRDAEKTRSDRRPTRYEAIGLPEAMMRCISVRVESCGKDNVKVADEIHEAIRSIPEISAWHGCADALTELHRQDTPPAMWSPAVERNIARDLLQRRADTVLPEYDGVDFDISKVEIARIGEHPFRMWLRQTYSKGAIFGEVAHFLHADLAQAVESGMDFVFVHGVRVYQNMHSTALISEPVCSFETNDEPNR